ncbi:dihydropteroate synthase [Flexibacterium corallicola]|uniref:dihydropteroate synthase n=1 Tax=Flexibacterium corallicola TaxID=3037259 RepID=UPI00286EEAF0|nr:dihydropteroate synthase [Pseudovibrio sp. M1P-2-3]
MPAPLLSALTSKRRPLVMGILNVTPDSFSDGGVYNAPETAFLHAQKMLEEGADILDVGGESTRPGATAISEQEELDRVLPVLEKLRGLNTLISIDTYKASVAEAAIKAGAHIVNDVWGLQKDERMAEVVAKAGVPVIMMHNRNEADETIDIMKDIKLFFDRSIELATKAGISHHNQILDPGFGFGKAYSQNYEILKRFQELKSHGRVLLAGASRKRMIGNLLNVEPKDRIFGSLAVHILAMTGGARIIRAHDVKAHVDSTHVFHEMQELGA